MSLSTKGLNPITPESLPVPLFMYRYEEEHHYAWGDGTEENGTYTATIVSLRTFRVVKVTPCGVWIAENIRPNAYGRYSLAGKKWVAIGTRKAYSRPTKQEALSDFIARKESHIWYCKDRLKKAEAALAAGEQMLKGESYGD